MIPSPFGSGRVFPRGNRNEAEIKGLNVAGPHPTSMAPYIDWTAAQGRFADSWTTSPQQPFNGPQSCNKFEKGTVQQFHINTLNWNLLFVVSSNVVYLLNAGSSSCVSKQTKRFRSWLEVLRTVGSHTLFQSGFIPSGQKWYLTTYHFVIFFGDFKWWNLGNGFFMGDVFELL